MTEKREPKLLDRIRAIKVNWGHPLMPAGPEGRDPESGTPRAFVPPERRDYGPQAGNHELSTKNALLLPQRSALTLSPSQ